MPKIVTASFHSAVPKNAPDEVVYIPVGENRISATVEGKPGEITVNVPLEKGEAIAAALNAALQKRIAGTVRPSLAFDHARTGPASAHPDSMRFDPDRGIILSAKWSRAGRAAIEGEDYSYFSPTFLVDADGIPCGIPDKGEIGSLVNEPAFRTIGRIAAADTSHQTEPNETTMSKQILAALNISESAATAESDAVKAIEKLKADHSTVSASLATVTQERDELKTKVEAAEAATKEANEKRIDAKVEAAVTAGKIAPKDEDTKKELLELLQASEPLADKHISAMPVKFANLDKTVVNASSAAANPNGEHQFLVEARKLVTAGQAKTEGEAFGLVSASNPDLYEDFNKQFKD